MENIVKKGEIAHFEQFHLFSQCFPKVFFPSKCIYMEERVNPLPNDRILDQPRWKEFADDKVNGMEKKKIFVLGRLENVV